jgi:hypothetical protein
MDRSHCTGSLSAVKPHDAEGSNPAHSWKLQEFEKAGQSWFSGVVFLCPGFP